MRSAGAVLLTVDHDGSVDAVAFSADSARVASGGQSSKVAIRTLGVGTQRDLPAAGFVSSLAFAPDGSRLAVADLDQVAVHAVTTDAASIGGPVEASSSVNFVTFSPDGANLVATTDALLAVLDAQSGALVRTVAIGRTIADAELSADGTLVALAIDERHGGDHRNAGSARIIELATGVERSRLTPDNAVHGVALSPDGTKAACGSADGTTRLFSTSDGEELWNLPIEANHLAFDPQGKNVLVGDADGFARVLDIRRGVERSRAEHVGAVTHVAFAPNGKWAASAGIDNTLQVFNAQTGLKHYSVATAEAKALGFSANSRWLGLGTPNSLVVYDNGESP